MHPLILALENDDFESFKKEVNPSSLSEQDNDGWNVLSLCVQYGMPEFVEYLLDKMSIEQINNQKPQHPLSIAIENNDENIFNLLLSSKKINLNYKEKSNENFLFKAFYSENDLLLKKLLTAGVNPYEKNKFGASAFSLCIEANKNFLIEEFSEHIVLQENYDELFIAKSIQYNNNEMFNKLFPYSSMEKDKLFKLCVDFGNIYATSKILDTENFRPGREQIQSMIEMICKKYDIDEEKKASLEIIDFLFTIKLPFNQFTNKDNQSAWMLSIENDNFEVFSKLIGTSENVNSFDNEKHSPLMYAIDYNKADFVASLLKKKANPNHTDRYKNTPLIKAVSKGNRAIVSELLKYSAHINEINENNDTALTLAIKMRRMDIVTDLIWAGGEITTNPVKFIEEENVFHFNINGQYEKLLTFDDEKNIDNFISLSQLGFNLNQTNEEGDTFLLHFIKNGFISNYKTLLKCPMNPNQNDVENNSAAMCAMNKTSNSYIENLLLRFNNIDLNIKNKNSETIYDLCLKQKKSERMELLVNYDDNLSVDNAKKAAFFLAKHGNLENSWEKISSVLLKNGIKDLKDEFGNTLLMISLAGDNKKNYDFILKNKIFLNLKEKNISQQNIYQLIEKLPDEKKSQYKESILYYNIQGSEFSSFRKI